MDFRTDKKANARYWDEIDATIERMLCEVADFSDEKLDKDSLDMISDGIIADVREMVINYLTEKGGGSFPFVNGDM